MLMLWIKYMLFRYMGVHSSAELKFMKSDLVDGILAGYKSYGQTVFIGPFTTSLTCIVGNNGTGIDARSHFLLDAPALHLLSASGILLDICLQASL